MTCSATCDTRSVASGVRQRAGLVEGGLVDEECEVWDSRGRLVAQARQLAAVRTPRHRDGPSVR